MPLPGFLDKIFGGSGKTSEEFARKNTKFWIKYGYELETFQRLIVRNLPLSAEVGGRVTSWYFDSPNFDVYEERQRRLDGARLLRIRYYGDQIGDKVFIELKTHHKGAMSTKVRYECATEDVPLMIWGPNTDWVSVDRAKRKAAGKKSKDGEKEDFDLLVQRFVEVYGQKPNMKTTCIREYYQDKSNPLFRITLDTQLQMVALDIPNDSNGIPKDPRSWVDKEVYDFPFAVLELKDSSNGEQELPPWLKESLETCIPLDLFSKYLHGCCVLYKQPRILMPIWFHSMELLLMETENTVENYIAGITNDERDTLVNDNIQWLHYFLQKLGQPIPALE